MMTASASMFYIANDDKSESNMKVAANSINIRIHQLFPKQRILGVRMTTQQKISGDLTRTCS